MWITVFKGLGWRFLGFVCFVSVLLENESKGIFGYQNGRGYGSRFCLKTIGFVGLKGCCKNGRGACKVEGVEGVKGYSLGFLYG